MQVVAAALGLVHAGAGALWLGAMGYSLFVVQPRLGRMLGDPARVEDAQRELAHGNRWPVVGLLAVLWLTGLGLAGLPLAGYERAGSGLVGYGLAADGQHRESAMANPAADGLAGDGLAGDGAGTVWWLGVAVKAGLLAAATALFWWVSWRGWPRRVFALPAELPGLQRRFRAVAVTMLALVATAFAVGVLL